MFLPVQLGHLPENLRERVQNWLLRFQGVCFNERSLSLCSCIVLLLSEHEKCKLNI